MTASTVIVLKCKVSNPTHRGIEGVKWWLWNKVRSEQTWCPCPRLVCQVTRPSVCDLRLGFGDASLSIEYHIPVFCTYLNLYITYGKQLAPLDNNRAMWDNAYVSIFWLVSNQIYCKRIGREWVIFNTAITNSSAWFFYDISLPRRYIAPTTMKWKLLWCHILLVHTIVEMLCLRINMYFWHCIEFLLRMYAACIEAF